MNDRDKVPAFQPPNRQNANKPISLARGGRWHQSLHYAPVTADIGSKQQ